MNGDYFCCLNMASNCPAIDDINNLIQDYECFYRGYNPFYYIELNISNFDTKIYYISHVAAFIMFVIHGYVPNEYDDLSENMDEFLTPILTELYLFYNSCECRKNNHTLRDSLNFLDKSIRPIYYEEWKEIINNDLVSHNQDTFISTFLTFSKNLINKYSMDKLSALFRTVEAAFLRIHDI